MDIINQDHFYQNLAQPTLKQLINKKLSAKDKKSIIKWYKSQPVNQVNKRPSKGQYYHIKVSSVGFIASDLMDYSKFFNSNGGMHYILTLIDMYSKYAWAFPIKLKEPSLILPHMKEVMKFLIDNDFSWITFICIAVNEFKGVVKKWIDENNIKQYIAYNPDDPDVKNRAAMIESFNGQLSTRINKATYVSDSSN